MATDKLINHSQGESIITNLGTIATNLQNVTAISPAKFGMGYAVCDTAAGTAAKTANIANYVLTEGALVTVKFTNANTASNATLNLNNTGAKPLLYKGSALTTDIISAGDICTFIYSTANSGSYNIINVDALSGAGAGTVKSVGAEGGLTTDQTAGAAISTTGNVKLNLKSNTAFTATAPDPVEIENKIYPVALDASGHPAVSVPGTTYTEGTGIDITNNVIKNTGVTAVAPSDSSTGTNGTISVTTNGTTAEVAVKGLNNAAYKDVDTSIPSSGATDNKVPTTAAVKSGLDSKLDSTANAVSAAKLNTGSADYEVGTATKGVYFDDGIPKAMTYSVEADVPSGAVFTDTTYTEATNSAISVDNTNHTIDVAAATTTAKGVVQLSTTLPASTATEDNKVPTALTVSKAIAALPEPMVFKGTVNGTYPATPSVGDTYKATANSTSGVTPAYKMGDTVIYSEPSAGTFEWVVIPSGDEPSGTVTGITGSDGIVTLDSTTSSSTISTSGTAKLALVTNHTTTVNAGNATSTANRSYPVAIDGNSKLAVNVPWENTTYANGSGITIGSGNAINHSNSVTAVTTAGAYKVKYDAQGHITGTSALAASDISAVPTSRTVNSKALSSDITLAGSDVALTGYSKASSASAVAATDTVNQAIGKLEKDLDGYVPTSRTINSKALSSNITLAGSDLVLTGYSKGSSTAAIAATDTINAAFAKHENRINTNQSNILYAIRNGAKNLCNPILNPAYYNENGANITRTYSNGAITIKGTTAAAEAYLSVCEEFTPITTGDYVFSSASGLIQGKLEMYVAAGSSFVGERVTSTNPARTYSLTAGTTYTLGMVVSGNYTIDTTIYPMLCEKTVWDNLNHDFQPPSLPNYDLTRMVNDLQKKAVKVYTYHVNPNESDPEDAVTYLDDAAGLTPAKMGASSFSYGSWANAWFLPRPCVLKFDGTVDYYLNPNDYSKKTDGTASTIDSSNSTGNVMLEFPKIWVKRVNDGNGARTVSIAPVNVDGTYKCWSNINAEDKEIDHFYLPAYNGTIHSSKMRSLSGVTLNSTYAPNYTRAQEVTAATANNPTGKNMWYTETWADFCLIYDLLYLMGKSLDVQRTFGQGLSSGSETAMRAYVTGTHNAKGLFYGDISGTSTAVKVLGMENLWGCRWHGVAGLINDNGTLKVKMTYGVADGSTAVGYNTTGSGYLNYGSTYGTNGYVKKMQADNTMGYKIIETAGTDATYYCDYYYVNNSQSNYALLGGRSGSDADCGFCVRLAYGAAFAVWHIGGSLSCRP